MHKVKFRGIGFRATFAALFLLNFCLRELPLSSFANRFELQCQSRATDTNKGRFSYTIASVAFD